MMRYLGLGFDSRQGFAGLVVAIYALSDEIHQSFVPERTSDWRDVAADLCGAVAALVTIAIAGRFLWPLMAARTTRDLPAAAPLHDLPRKEPT